MNTNELQLKVNFPVRDGNTILDLVEGPLTYKADGLATKHNCDFIKEPRFQNAYASGLATIESRRPGINVAWRVHTVCWAADHCSKLEGDFVECGVFTGILSKSICEYVQFQNQKRTFWLFDTFEGIPVEQLNSDEVSSGVANQNRKYGGDCYLEVKETFATYSNVEVIKGKVPDTLTNFTGDKVAYLSIDMNAAYPERQAMEFFWDKLVSGAVIVLDDYGWDAHKAQKLEMDAFAQEKGVSIFSLPTGQGLILKP